MCIVMSRAKDYGVISNYTNFAIAGLDTIFMEGLKVRMMGTNVTQITNLKKKT